MGSNTFVFVFVFECVYIHFHVFVFVVSNLKSEVFVLIVSITYTIFFK